MKSAKRGKKLRTATESHCIVQLLKYLNDLHLVKMYRIYPKYRYTLPRYHTFPKKSTLLPATESYCIVQLLKYLYDLHLDKI